LEVGQQSPIKPSLLHLACDEQELLPPDVAAAAADDDDDEVECFVVGVSFGVGSALDAVVAVKLSNVDSVGTDASAFGLATGRLMEDESGDMGPDGPGYK
jgi:hypothetical protein